MIVESVYRQYDSSPDAWGWLLPLLDASWHELNS